MTIDPLDVGEPRQRAWEEFRAQYASALLLHWMLQDVESVLPSYVKELWLRLSTAFDYEPILRDSGDYDGWLPVHGPHGVEDNVEFWIEKEHLELLWERLFPHDLDQRALDSVTAVMVVIQLHSVLENYAKAVGVVPRPYLPDALIGAIGQDAVTVASGDVLRELDAVRNVWVHNAGVVDQTYLRRSHNSRFELGERRLVRTAEVDRFADAVLAAAKLLHTAHAP